MGFYRVFATLLVVIAALVRPVPAPVPRCSPLYLINKVVEFTNIFSDSNPYFPVPPCEYGGPVGALAAGDLDAVFVSYRKANVPRHNIYEFFWFWKTGLPRIIRMIKGQQQFYADKNILFEKYSHYTPYTRTRHLGFNTHRQREIIDNKDLWKSLLKKKINALKTDGPDTFDATRVREFPGRFQGSKRRRNLRPRPPPRSPPPPAQRGTPITSTTSQHHFVDHLSKRH